MSTYYPDGIPLTPQQVREDFESANPGKSAVSGVSASRPDSSLTNSRRNNMATDVRVTVYSIDTPIRFGKYRIVTGAGEPKTIQDLMEVNPTYLIWCHENIEWFALEEDLYIDACLLADREPDKSKLKKATQTNEQPSGGNWDDEEEEEEEEDLVDKLNRDTKPF